MVHKLPDRKTMNRNILVWLAYFPSEEAGFRNDANMLSDIADVMILKAYNLNRNV